MINRLRLGSMLLRVRNTFVMSMIIICDFQMESDIIENKMSTRIGKKLENKISFASLYIVITKWNWKSQFLFVLPIQLLIWKVWLFYISVSFTHLLICKVSKIRVVFESNSMDGISCASTGGAGYIFLLLSNLEKWWKKSGFLDLRNLRLEYKHKSKTRPVYE